MYCHKGNSIRGDGLGNVGAPSDRFRFRSGAAVNNLSEFGNLTGGFEGLVQQRC